MSPQFAAIAALLSIAVTTGQANAQNSVAPAPDAGVSVVMRCKDCGTLQSIREVQAPRAVSPPTSDTASPVGLMMYVPIGRNARTEGAYVGSAGTRQWQERTANTRYEFTVRMDDGNFRTLPRQGVSDFKVGDRVKVTQFEIEHWTQ